MVATIMSVEIIMNEMETQTKNKKKRLLYYSVSDLCNNRTAQRLSIKNEPNEEQKNNIEELIVNILDPLQSICMGDIVIERGFLNKRLSKLLKVDENSPLRNGTAAIIYSVKHDETWEVLQGLEHDELICITEKSNCYTKKTIMVSYVKGNNRNISRTEVVYTK